MQLLPIREALTSPKNWYVFVFPPFIVQFNVKRKILLHDKTRVVLSYRWTWRIRKLLFVHFRRFEKRNKFKKYSGCDNCQRLFTHDFRSSRFRLPSFVPILKWQKIKRYFTPCLIIIRIQRILSKDIGLRLNDNYIKTTDQHKTNCLLSPLICCIISSLIS